MRFCFSNALNECIEFIKDTSTPIFALCNGTDKKNSRVIGTVIEGNWFIRIEICSTGFESLNVIKDSSKIFQQHLELSHACERDVSILFFLKMIGKLCMHHIDIISVCR